MTPTLTESGGVEYAPIQPIHMPGGIQVYKFTNSRTFEITAHFVSRSTQDALTNQKYIQTLRAWRYPYFGKSVTNIPQAKTATDDWNKSADRIKSSNNSKGVNLLGAPPEVVYLYGYSPAHRKSTNDISAYNINRIPVVLTGLSIQYPEDVDYIPTTLTPNSTTESFPVKIDVSISLTETHSPVEYEQFSLQQFKEGKLTHF